MDFQTRLHNAASKDIEAYKVFFKELVETSLSTEEMKQIVSLLEDINDTDPDFVKEAALYQQSLLNNFDNEFLAANYYLLIIALLKTENFADVALCLKEALNKCTDDDDSFDYGICICENIRMIISDNDLSQDAIIVLYKLISDYYLKINQEDEAVDVMISAACRFSSLKATQSAYRLIYEIEKMLWKRGKSNLLGPVYAALAEAAVSENDYPFADEMYKKSFEVFEQNNQKIPIGTSLNYATVFIRMNNPLAAIGIYDKILQNDLETESSITDFIIQYHKGICWKDAGEENKAKEIFEGLESTADNIEIQVRQDINLDILESLIDYSLCYSLLIAKLGKNSKALSLLEKSIYLIELLLNSIFRPHYKRGIREKYNNRILSVTDYIIEKTPSNKLLFTFCYLKKNSQTDWLSILSWMKNIHSNSDIAKEELIGINAAFRSLEEIGGVLMSGFKEKYDDPFQNPNLLELGLIDTPENVLPWQVFESEVHMLSKKFNLRNCFDENKTDDLVSILKEKISNGLIILFSFLRKSGYVVYQISSEKKKEIVIPYNQNSKYYYASLKEYQIGQNRSRFLKNLENLADDIKLASNELIEEISKSDARGIYFFPNVLDSYFPFIQSLLSESNISDKLKNGDFFIQICPLMYQKDLRDNKFDKVSIIKNDDQKLELFDEEVAILDKNFSCSVKLKDLSGIEVDTDVVHIVSHGQPISHFTDAAYSFLSNGSMHLYDFSGLREMPIKLIYINACNAGETVNKNFQKTFITHELTGFTTASLQNTGAFVLSSHWPTLDLASYLFAKIFYNYLLTIKNVQIAHSRAIWTLKNENKSYFLKFLEEIEDPRIRNKKINNFNSAPDKPFDHLFLYSGMLLHGLI
ncbi:MAG: CHAT domain-containing protein [Sphingobacterium sp.]|jgi:tetratricopeptide (TPR) repeat protein|uniref:CHAT domain-containing protein n=1 Tax=Sphingobacterium sp. TaxID=341027 RepID=UPI00285054BC|nr:CHAT domain-containing protein [Sphingobacterium sp.]MDR3007448.1 CHAT domain-containing protein [Sphingobacterium sp.]